MVIARNDETGVSGVFPVSAVMSRQAIDLIWLTLENNTGEITRMGITSEHPLFAVSEGWLDASEIVAGDRVRDSELRELTVVAVKEDTRPQIVHNLEIADAHTYFAGEFEAWGHNAFPFGKQNRNSSRTPCETVLYKLIDRETGIFLKWGITSRPLSVREAEHNRDKRFGGRQVRALEQRTGTKCEIKKLERRLVQRFGGAFNREPWSSSRR